MIAARDGRSSYGYFHRVVKGASRRLDAMEETLRVEFFLRTRDGYVLTPEGYGSSTYFAYLADAQPTLVRIGEVTPPSPIVLLLHRDLRHAVRIKACCDAIVAGIRAQADMLRGDSRRQ